jgi:hypothetical protein
MYRLPGYRLRWEVRRSEIEIIEMVQRWAVAGGSRPRPRLRIARSGTNDELIVLVRGLDGQQDVAHLLRTWVDTGRLDSGLPALTKASVARRILPSAALSALVLWLGLGFALGYVVFSSSAFLAGILGAMAAAAAWWAVFLFASVVLHVRRGSARTTPPPAIVSNDPPSEA